MPTPEKVHAQTIVRRQDSVADAYVTVDLAAIAQILGPRAMKSKGKQATALHKAVIVEVRNIRKQGGL